MQNLSDASVSSLLTLPVRATAALLGLAPSGDLRTDVSMSHPGVSRHSSLGLLAWHCFGPFLLRQACLTCLSPWLTEVSKCQGTFLEGCWT